MASILRSTASRSALFRHSGAAAACRRFAASAAALWEDDDLDYWTDCEKMDFPLAEGTCGERGPRGVQWVFMGSPGAQKHVYAARMAQLLDVPYISMGTLVRQELNPRSSIYIKIANSVNEGKLVQEDIIFSLLSKRLEERYNRGETGFILDGIPKTRLQAEILDQIADIDLVVNFKSKDENVIKQKLRGQSAICSHCGKPFNMTQPESNGSNPCLDSRTSHGLVRSKSVLGLDNNTYLNKMHAYFEQSKVLEEYYKEQKKLLNFQVCGGLGETWQGLLAALQIQHVDTPISPQQLTI
ncbi:hypothetical protein LUZ60_015636 [Juncus effusus]|nr:hypothetical protein LUZ60_015636 [Juncus effusus]